MSMELQEILNSYDHLVPPRDVGSVVILLSQKIEKKEIDQNFTYQDFQQSIIEIAAIEPGGQPHTERILKSLLHYFIERPAEKRDRYKLTEYALNFLKLIENKLNNPYRNFPLQESFKRYTTFKAADIKNINHFESWFEQGFNATTKQTILNHLEGLKDEVDFSNRELNGILYSSEPEILTTVNKFSVAFKAFGDKAEEIRDTLRLGINLEQEIDDVVKYFYIKIEQAKHPETDQEQREHELLQGEFYRASRIQRNVLRFFVQVDEKLSQLKDKILFSSTKLTELKDNFKYQTNFKINIKRFLNYILQEGKYSNEGPRLPEDFPRKSIPLGFHKFIIVPRYEFLISIQNTVITTPPNEKYKRKEKEKIDLELTRQENTVKWVNKLRQMLEANHTLDFTPHFYDIIDAEQDVEIALQVGFELFQFANRNGEMYRIDIDKELVKAFSKKDVVTWKMQILQKS